MPQSEYTPEPTDTTITFADKRTGFFGPVEFADGRVVGCRGVPATRVPFAVARHLVAIFGPVLVEGEPVEAPPVPAESIAAEVTAELSAVEPEAPSVADTGEPDAPQETEAPTSRRKR